MCRKGFRCATLALAGGMALASLAGASGAAASTGTHEVRFGAYSIEVPAAWPVYDLAADPTRCVRFDRHAVYLGHPGPDERCPADAVGHTEAILIEPLEGAADRRAPPDTLRAVPGKAAPRRLPSPSATELSLAVPSAGVLVSATWQRDPALVRRIIDDASLLPRAGPPPAQPAPPAPERAQPQRAPGPRAKAYLRGLGFDACGAPSESALSAWAASPYDAVGIYIGGINRGCSQPNLTAAWVRHEVAARWALIPIYVGLQAPGTSCSCATISRGRAQAQGKAAARDAIRDARRLGLGPGSPIYFDMEYYARSSANSAAALKFLSGWTSQLHAGGFVSGVYSSGAAGIADLVSRYTSGYREPDDIWIANWNGRRTSDDPYVPDAYWTHHQRLRQYRGAHNETYRGVTMNIDNDFLDGALAGVADRDGDGVPDPADLCSRVRGPIQDFGCPYPSYVSGELTSYEGFVKGDPHHGDRYATTRGVRADYRFRANLGFLSASAQPGTVPLYSCLGGHDDHFLSLGSDCHGARAIGRLGYVYSSDPADLPNRAIYACSQPNGERFVAPSSSCGRPRNTTHRRLGFTIATAPLVSYRQSIKGSPQHGRHWATTAGVPAAYRLQRNLGLLHESSWPETLALYGCRSGSARFLSAAFDCDNAKQLGRVGYAYATSPSGIPSSAIYSCLKPNGDRTVSRDPACGGATDEGLLGYTISVAPLGRYVEAVSGDRREGDRYVTTGAVPAAYRFQASLGFLYRTEEPGTIPLYGCSTRRDQFVSQSSDCGGARALGTLGYAYSSSPKSIPTRAIYRCRGRDGERTVSYDPDCGGAGDGDLLGYALVSPLVG